ncbi:MAG TPA: YdcH family protein [Candidatus Limnocylindrales bacterium]|nr:YdcH family protein [Candidatus Limnocylindrales bacterium]
MDPRDEELVKSLAPEHAELRRSYERHAQLKAEVDDLTQRPHLTTEEELHRRELQKQKLVEKDRIARFLGEYRQRGQVSSGS